MLLPQVTLHCATPVGRIIIWAISGYSLWFTVETVSRARIAAGHLPSSASHSEVPIDQRQLLFPLDDN
jgi:hypothetical protein